MYRSLGLLVSVCVTVVHLSEATAATLRVGPDQSITRIADAARAAKDGDVVEIEAGEYFNDVASWSQNNLTIRGIRGRARVVVKDVSAEEKAIWVIKGHNVTIENVELAGAHVASRNGAGIRHEGGKLTIRNALFERNEMGVLTWNNDKAELVVEGCEFRDNAGDESFKISDPGHQIYVGRIARFTLRASYVHRGAFGHLVKTRARENHIYFNRLTDETGGRASYELELPNGGIAYVVGNIIGQNVQTDNPRLISFGVEGYRWPRNELYLVNNTLVDDLAQGGIFLRVSPGADRVKVMNNLLVGEGRFESGGGGEFLANFRVTAADFTGLRQHDYRLAKAAPLRGRAMDPKSSNGIALRPREEYVHPMRTRPVDGLPYSPGAIQSSGG